MTRIPQNARSIDSRPLLAFWAAAMGARTTRDVQRLLGLGSPETSHRWMRLARDAGLVDFLDGKASTLHPLYRIVWVAPNDGAD